jgi:hypothetical protein
MTIQTAIWAQNQVHFLKQCALHDAFYMKHESRGRQLGCVKTPLGLRGKLPSGTYIKVLRVHRECKNKNAKGPRRVIDKVAHPSSNFANSGP